MGWNFKILFIFRHVCAKPKPRDVDQLLSEIVDDVLGALGVNNILRGFSFC